MCIRDSNEGKLQVIGKERGRKRSLNKIVDMAVEQSKGWDNDMIMITHGDCVEEAEYVAGLVREKMGCLLYTSRRIHLPIVREVSMVEIWVCMTKSNHF